MVSPLRFFLVLLYAAGVPAVADGNALRIHLISGSAEYKSEESLRELKRTLEEDYAEITVTASWGRDGGDNLPGLGELADADLVIIFARRMKLPQEQLQYLHNHFKAEKPAIGIRTSSHAFQGYLEMDGEIFGGSYSGHGKDELVVVEVADDAQDHPILEGLKAWTRPDKIYYNRQLGPHTTTLLYGTGQTTDLREPLAWTNRYGTSGRAFYTSMGFPEDFQNENFRSMLLAAIAWVTERKLVVKNEE